MVSLLCAPVGPVAPVGPFGPLGPIKIPVLLIFFIETFLMELTPVGPVPRVSIGLRRIFGGKGTALKLSSKQFHHL